MPWQPAYAQLSELKTYLRISDAVDDAELTVALNAASRSIDQYTGRQFGVISAAAPRYYTPIRYEGRYVVFIDDLMSTTNLVVKVNSEDGGSYDTTLVLNEDYYLKGANNAADARPWNQIIGRNYSLPLRTDSVEVTALWGWTSVPAEVKQAALIQAARFFKRKDAPFGIAGSPEFGSELRLLNRLDPDVQLLLDPLRKIWGAA